MDANHWSGIALVLTALLAPFVTRYSSGGVAAKEQAKEAEERAEEAEKRAEAEKRSGDRWYRMSVWLHGRWEHERNGRDMDRSSLAYFPGAPSIPWQPLPPVPPFSELVSKSNDELG